MPTPSLETQLKRAGYSVSEAAGGYADHPATFRVEGHGSTLIVAADDEVTVAALVEQAKEASQDPPEQPAPSMQEGGE